MSLTGGAIALIPDMPESVMLPEKNYTSTSDAVLSRRHIEIAPINDGQPFTTTANNEIVFQIASTTSFWDLEHFYITGEISGVYTPAGGAGNTIDKYWKLNKTGIASLIQSVEVRSASTNTTFDKLEGYNVFCAMEDDLFMTPESLDRNFISEFKSSSDGDNGSKFTLMDVQSMDAEGAMVDEDSVVIPLTGTGTVPATSSTIRDVKSSSNLTVEDYVPEGTLMLGGGSSGQGTIAAARGAAQIATGALITERIYNGGANTEAANCANVMFTSSVGGADAAGLGAFIPQIAVHRPEYAENIGRRFLKQTGGNVSIPFALKLRNGFFRQKNDFPLFLLPRGLQIIITLDTNKFRFVHSLNPLAHLRTTLASGVPISSFGNYGTWNFSMTNLRAQCILKNMHSSINNQYLDLYTSGKGLLIPYTGYRWYQKTLQTSTIGSETLEINVGVRSARHVMARLIPSSIWAGTAAISKPIDVLHLAMSMGLNYFQFKAGSLDFPVRPIYLNNYDHPANVKRHHLITGNMERDQVNTSSRYEATPYLASASSMSPYLPQRTWPILAPTNAADKLIFSNGVPRGIYLVETLFRDDGYFAGTDISMQPLRIEMSFSGQNDDFFGPWYTGIGSNNFLRGDSRQFQCFVAHDAYIHMSEAGGIVRLS